MKLLMLLVCCIFSDSVYDVSAQNNCSGKKDGFYPYKLDCGQYIACSNGYSNIMPCPPGLWFDVKTKTCEHKELATNPFCSGFCANKKDGFYPDQSDCSKYITCANRFAITMKCPNDYHYDVVLKTCVVPEKAVNPTCNTSYCKNKANGVYPNLKDCSKYISCSNGYTHIMNCPKDLWYDVNKRYCEHKENATNPGCNAPKSHLTYHLTNQQKKELTYHKHNKPEFCVSKKDGLYQYKLDCHKYIQCSNKITHIMPCPRGLWFDVVKKYCEHKENATNPNCEDHVTTTSDPFVQTFCLNKKAKKICVSE